MNTPMKIFPYLHSGRPLLATRLPTHTQLLDDSHAMLADPDPAAFADAWVRLIEDRALAARLGAAGRQLVLDAHLYHHHRERVWALYALVEQAVAESRQAAPAHG